MSMVLGLCLAYSWSTSSAVCPWSWDCVQHTVGVLVVLCVHGPGIVFSIQLEY